MRIIFTAFALPLLGACMSSRGVDAGDGVRLWTTSRGRGTPIVVIHGGPGMDHHSLAADLEPLERKHRVIYYDQRSGGRSTLADRLTIDDHVRDPETLRRHHGLEKVTLLATAHFPHAERPEIVFPAIEEFLR